MFGQSDEQFRSRAVRGALVGLALIALAWGWGRVKEPRYLGRRVRSWIEQAPWDTSSNSEAQEALRYFGVRAVPYLLEAVERSDKWEHGLLARIPPRYINPILDLSEQRAVRNAAMWRLQELAREEIERNDLVLDPRYPVLDRLIPIWKRQLAWNNSGELLNAIANLGPKATNFSSELKIVLPGLRSGSAEWVQCSLALAQTHDPGLVPILLPAAAESKSAEIRRWAIHALAQNGCTNSEVAKVLRAALISTNHNLRTTAVLACAYLDLCTDQAHDVIQQVRNPTSSLDQQEAVLFDAVEPVMRWRENPQDVPAAAQVERNLGPDASPHVRMRTADLLQRIGPSAKQFTPALVALSQDRWPTLQAYGANALRAIDPAEANRILESLARTTTRR